MLRKKCSESSSLHNIVLTNCSRETIYFYINLEANRGKRSNLDGLQVFQNIFFYVNARSCHYIRSTLDVLF